MKKTLVALAVTAFATSASALTVYENDGSKVEFDGRVAVLLDNSGSKVTDGKGNKTSEKRNHSNLKNDGTRFGVKVKQDLGDDLYAFGRLEFRFDGNSKAADKFGDLYAKRAYVGFGSKQYGDIAFGRQVTLSDDIAQAGFDKTYGVTKTPLTTDGKSVIRYDYKGIEGLHLGADYRFAEERDANGEVTKDAVKSGYGVGAIYDFDVAQGQSATVALGYTRDNYKVDSNDRHYKDAVMLGTKYKINDLTLAFDYGFHNDKNGDVRETLHGFNTGAKYQVTPAVAVYGNYVYLNSATKEDGVKTAKDKSHRFMLGSEYQIHKNVLAFVEGSITNTKKYDANGVKTSKDRDNHVGVGLRIFW